MNSSPEPSDDPAVTGVPPEAPDDVRPTATGLVTGPVEGDTDVDVAHVSSGDDGGDADGKQVSLDQVRENAEGGMESSTLDAPTPDPEHRRPRRRFDVGHPTVDKQGARSMSATATTQQSAEHLLAVYLRDHFAGAAAGVALAERCQRANADTALGDLLAELVDEIAADRDSLRRIMDALDVSENQVKAVLGQAAELVGRLKTNGMLTTYSPSSRVLELEGLLAGVDAKRNLWRCLRTAASSRTELDAAELDALIERADSQRARLRAAHHDAATAAFTST
jgi:hypothetical protein